MLERKLCSLPAELLLFRGVGWGGEEKFKINAKLSPAEARAELGKIQYCLNQQTNENNWLLGLCVGQFGQSHRLHIMNL